MRSRRIVAILAMLATSIAAGCSSNASSFSAAMPPASGSLKQRAATQYLYVGNAGNFGNPTSSVSVYKVGSVTPVRTMTFNRYLRGFGLDAANDVDAVFGDVGTIRSKLKTYAPGSSSVVRSAPLQRARGAAVAPSGDVYVSEPDLRCKTASIVAFGPTGTTARQIGDDRNCLFGVTTDASGNLYVLNGACYRNKSNLTNSVQIYAPNSASPKTTITKDLPACSSLIAVDPGGNIYVGESECSGYPSSESCVSSIAVFSAGGTLERTIKPSYDKVPLAVIAFDGAGDAAFAFADTAPCRCFHGGEILVYRKGADTPSTAIPLQGVAAIAFDDSGNLYAAASGSVRIYAPGATKPAATITTGITNPAFMAFGTL